MRYIEHITELNAKVRFDEYGSKMLILYEKRERKIMNQTDRFEAAVAGDGIAALLAGYLLKMHKIKFTFVKMNNGEEMPVQSSSLETTQEQNAYVSEILEQLITAVGIENIRSMDETGEKRLSISLKSILKNEIEHTIMLKSIHAQDDYYFAVCAENDAFGDNEAALESDDWNLDKLELDMLLNETDLLKSGMLAEAVYEEKRQRLNAYRKRLRIQEATREPRKMVYVTQSKSWFFAKEAVMQYALEQNVAAINPFMNYGYYLSERVDREEITASCHQLIRACEEMWVFGPISEATLTEIVVAVMEGKEIRFFSISEVKDEIKEISLDKIIFEREVHAGQIHKSDLLEFIQSNAPRTQNYTQMSLF